MLITARKTATYEAPTRIRVYDHFFRPDVYERLNSNYRETLALGLNESDTAGRFSRIDYKHPSWERPYDAYYVPIEEEPVAPLDVFWSVELYSFLLREFSIPISPDVQAALHYHLPGSETGDIHSDYCMAIYQRLRLKNGMHQARTRCLEEFKAADARKLEKHGIFIGARAIALVYYLSNEDWKPGDGGETAFFASQSVESMVCKVSPNNNRLVAFEVSPSSFHAFQKNQSKERCSITAFLFCPFENATVRFSTMPASPRMVKL